jgi:hypothetical protein
VRVEEIFGLTLNELSQGSRQQAVVKARSVLCYWAVKELGTSGAQVARWLGIGQPAVQRSVVRGEKIDRDLSLELWPKKTLKQDRPLMPSGRITQPAGKIRCTINLTPPRLPGT